VRFLDSSKVDFFDTGFKNVEEMLEPNIRNTVTVQGNEISREGSHRDISSESSSHEGKPDVILQRICVFNNRTIMIGREFAV
jgi:hypothetical protein